MDQTGSRMANSVALQNLGCLKNAESRWRWSSSWFGIEQLLKCEDFSSLRRLLSVMCWSFCRILLRKTFPDAVPTALPELRVAAEFQQMFVKNKNFTQWRDLFQDDNKLWQCGGSRWKLEWWDFGMRSRWTAQVTEQVFKPCWLYHHFPSHRVVENGTLAFYYWFVHLFDYYWFVH